MIIANSAQLVEVIDFINENDKLAYDIETNSLDTIDGKIIGFGISNASKGYYITHLNYNVDKKELVEMISFNECVNILELLKSKKLITFNGSFDSRFTYNYFKVNLIESLWSDAMLAKHTADEERPFRLKDIAKKLYGDDAAEEQRLMKESIKANGGNPSSDYYMADIDIMAKYCVQDCILTYKINEHYLEKLEQEGLIDFYFKDEVMPLYTLVTIPMELNGVKVDVELIEQTRADIVKDINMLEDRIQAAIDPMLGNFKKHFLKSQFPPRRSGEFAQYICKYADLDLPKTKSGRYSVAAKALESLELSIYKDFLLGGDYLPQEIVYDIQRLWWADQDEKYMFNLSSKHHLKRLFFDELGETPISKTDKGNPQVDHLFLSEMANKYKWADLLQQYNKLNKLKSTYMDRFIDEHKNGIVYPSFFQHRTISGRYGSNLQQLPRPKEEGELPEIVLKYNNIIRKFFISRSNKIFVDADYESLEPHVFAHVSGDNGLKDIFRKGHDFYSTIAIQTEKLEGVSADKKADNYLGKVNKPLRQKAKAYSLGVPYGMESYALSKTLDIEQSEAEELINGYLNGFPKLKVWMEKSFNDCITKGYVKSEAGRVRHMSKAPKIWNGWGEDILNSLKIWQKYHSNKKKYEQVKYLRKELKNYINNSRNFQIQSLSASITNRACIAIAREFKRQGIDGKIIAQIHDQIIIEVPSKYGDKWKKIMQFIMENTYKISLPLKAPAELAENMADGH